MYFVCTSRTAKMAGRTRSLKVSKSCITAVLLNLFMSTGVVYKFDILHLFFLNTTIIPSVHYVLSENNNLFFLTLKKIIGSMLLLCQTKALVSIYISHK